jgi:predicted TIM-barrel enzyme
MCILEMAKKYNMDPYQDYEKYWAMDINGKRAKYKDPNLEYGRQFTRQEVRDRLAEQIKAGKPIIGTGCSSGLIARAEEVGGSDFIICYHTDRARSYGLSSFPPGFQGRDANPNATTLQMAAEFLKTVESVPVICGCDTTDLSWRLDKFLDKVVDVGASGVIIFPSTTLRSPPDSLRYKRAENYGGTGLTREMRAVKLAQERDLFTMTYVVWEPFARAYAKADIDAVCVHVGGTIGGIRDPGSERIATVWPGKVGGYTADTVEGMAGFVKTVLNWIKDENPRVIPMAHGGILSVPNDVMQYLWDKTDAVGFLGASSFERIPVEKGVAERVIAFKKQTLPDHKHKNFSGWKFM